jgi:uncharacterized protein YacL
MVKRRDPLKIIGIVIIIVSALILFSAFPLISQTMFKLGPLEANIPQLSVTRLTIGIVGVIIGLVIYYGKEGLKSFMK